MNNKYKIFMIFSIVVLVITIIVSTTYAYYVWTTEGSNVTKIVAGVGTATVTFDGGSDITGNLKPVSNKNKGLSKTIKVKADTSGLVFNLYLDMTSLDTNLKHESFKYEFYKGITKVKEGDFSDAYLTSNTTTCTKNNTTHITLLTDESISTSNTEYTLYIWVDGANYTNPSTMMNKSFLFKLHADGEGAVVSTQYTLTNGDGSTYTPTYTGTGTKAVRSTAPLSTFKEVKVDDETVASSNYTLSEGSTIVTFKESYLKTLSVGNHAFKIISNDGIASGILTIKEVITAATYITNLYNNSSKTSVTNNSITYQYDTTHSLMKDVGNNIRYYGADPNNYIYFNCSNYSNQIDSTCEKWRIIGVFDGKVKIMRNEIVGDIAYDNNNEDTYLASINYDDNEVIVKPLSNDENNKEENVKFIVSVPGKTGDTGENDYSKSSLQKILNNYYYNSLKYTGNSTYDFTSTGIKNDITRNMITDVTWNLGGHSTSSVYSDTIYEKERGTTVNSGNSTKWTGKIALAYPSDYGYAADLSKCIDKQLNKYGDSNCTANNWMKSIMTSNFNWLLTPYSDDATVAWNVDSSGDVGYNYLVYNVIGVAPVLYLSSELSIGSGDGSSSSPYKLSV